MIRWLKALLGKTAPSALRSEHDESGDPSVRRSPLVLGDPFVLSAVDDMVSLGEPGQNRYAEEPRLVDTDRAGQRWLREKARSALVPRTMHTGADLSDGPPFV